MGQLDFSALTPALFIVSAVFIMLIGSAVSVAVLRAFQQRYRQMAVLLVSSAALTALLIFVLRTWF